jgi:hypothetical protein
VAAAVVAEQSEAQMVQHLVDKVEIQVQVQGEVEMEEVVHNQVLEEEHLLVLLVQEQQIGAQAAEAAAVEHFQEILEQAEE